MLDNRKSIRRRTNLTGRLAIGKLPFWGLGCTVRNLSDGGACIAIERTALIPDIVELDISGGTPRRARLVWAREGRAGLALVDGDAPMLEPWSRSSGGAPTTDAGRLQARIAALASKPLRPRGTSMRGFTLP